MADLHDAGGVLAGRLFTMELARRLALGEVATLLGELGLSTDVDSRLTGMTHVADQMSRTLTDDQRARLQAYAEGVNAAIAAIQAGELPPPSELDLAGPLLGLEDPTSLLTPFEVRDVAAVLATRPNSWRSRRQTSTTRRPGPRVPCQMTPLPGASRGRTARHLRTVTPL